MFDKKQLTKLALGGLITGIVIASQTASAANKDTKDLSSKDFGVRDSSDGNLGYHLMTEEELSLELTPEVYSLYQGMDEENKALSRYVASQRCNGTNACKGLNACATDEHDCAGKGSCKGKGKCAFSDKNLAVKLVANKMAEKRKNAQK